MTVQDKEYTKQNNKHISQNTQYWKQKENAKNNPVRQKP